MYDSNKGKYVKKGTTTSTACKISKLTAGTIYKFKVRAINSSSKGAYSSVLKTATKTKTPTIKKTTAGTKKATIKWGKISGATGYEVYMSTSKNGTYKKVKTVKISSTVKYTKTKLKKNKKYYFKIRTYKTVSRKQNI